MGARDFEGQRFTVTVTELTKGFQVDVDAGPDQFAHITTPDVDVALAMAVPYMRAVAVPDPFEALYRQPSPPDGPVDHG